MLNTFEPKKVVHILTHKEAFSFLLLLGHRKTREIIVASRTIIPHGTERIERNDWFWPR